MHYNTCVSCVQTNRSEGGDGVEGDKERKKQNIINTMSKESCVGL